MKSALSALATLMFAIQPNSYGTIPAPAPSDQQTVAITEATTSLSLEHTDKEPIFQNQQVPDTRYRDVQQGTREDTARL